LRVLLGLLLSAAILITTLSCASKSAADQMWMGDAAMKQENWDQAIIGYQKALEINPTMPDLNQRLATAYNNRGKALVESKDYKTALDDLNKAVNLNPLLGEAYNNRAWAYNGTGDYTAAIADLNRAQ